MAGSVNKVILIGNVGRDPEIRQSADGRKIVNLSLATSETWKDKTGERQEKTEWHRVVIFNQGLADVAERYVKKGSKLYIEGSLQTRKYTDSSGVEKYSTEVVLGNYRGEMTLLDNKNGSGESVFSGASAGFDAPAASAGWDSKPAASNNLLDDEIPF
ncbi:MAG: single-stranded DNA-binding protein [Alphaproteobacteria bacterium]|nr:single-stranded DNA-binding protein [Alphaproteobacteria bacterium]MBO4643311.1 single-stranded DNA-binding protein [Alphaproteobacteria bacterium]